MAMRDIKMTSPPPAPKAKGKETDENEQESKFLTDVLRDYGYWNKQEGPLAKAYAAAYRTLLNEFTAEENKE